MTLEELTKKYEDLQKDFLAVSEELKTTKTERDEATTKYEDYVKENDVIVSELKERNDSLVEHNNNLFRQVTHKQAPKGLEVEETPEDAIKDILAQFE